jgi:hypothetical protein
MGTERATLFADPGVLPFYDRLGWDLEPNGHRCGFGTPIEWLKGTSVVFRCQACWRFPAPPATAATWRSQGCGADTPPAASDGHRW